MSTPRDTRRIGEPCPGLGSLGQWYASLETVHTRCAIFPSELTYMLRERQFMALLDSSRNVALKRLRHCLVLRVLAVKASGSELEPLVPTEKAGCG